MKKYEMNYHAGTPYIALDIAEEVVERLNDNEYKDIIEAIMDEMDSALIYYKAQWEILMEYCNPETADLQYATEALFDDIMASIEEVEEEEQ